MSYLPDKSTLCDMTLILKTISFINKTDYMNIIIQSKNFRVDNSLETLIRDKVGKLYNKCKSIIRVEVNLRQGGHGDLENKLCEMRLLIPGNDHIVKVNSSVYEKSVFKAVNVLEKIVRRKKAKLISKRHIAYN